MKEYKSVKLEKEVITQLEAIKHPGQTLNGVIQELLNTRAKLAGADAALGELLDKVKKDA